MVKDPPFNVGDTSWIPGQGTKIPRATGHLSLYPQLLSLHTSTRERKKKYPHTTAREKAAGHTKSLRTATKRPDTAKNT